MASKREKELAKERSERKRLFYSKLYNEIFHETEMATEGLQSKLDFKIQYSGRNRYITYSVYGFKMNICFFTKGEIVLKLQEACHGNFEQELFKYTDSVEKQEDFLEYFGKIMSFLIPLFAGKSVVDPHTFMDYVKDDIEAAIDRVQEEWTFHGVKEAEEDV